MKRKLIAPIVITVITVLYYALYFLLILSFTHGLLRILLGILPILFSGVMIFVCLERIREIKGGEENDLSQY